jgi:hypothetical protein
VVFRTQYGGIAFLNGSRTMGALNMGEGKMHAPQPEHESDVESRYELYADYNKLYRNWMVAYGIGGPILFATNATLSAKMGRAEHSAAAISLFLAVVFLQVANALINKWCAWHMYSGEYESIHKDTPVYKISRAINKEYRIDFSVDVLSFVLLVAATIWVVVIVS